MSLLRGQQGLWISGFPNGRPQANPGAKDYDPILPILGTGGLHAALRRM